MTSKKQTRKRSYAFLAALVLSLLFVGVALAAGNIDATNKWAWGTNVGWINFAPDNGGVTVYGDHLEGYAWSENIGWIRLGVYTGGGSHTYTNADQTTYGVNNDGAGNLSGYAWGTNAGWINFAPANGGVTLDPATGDFAGYAWGENVGWIHFQNGSPAYKVNTTWRGAPPTCFATPDNGTTVFAGGDAHAVQQAVDAAPADGTVKVAGTCVGVETRAGTDQSVYIAKTLTLAGGYAMSNWTTSQPLTQPTILDAAGAGRVIYASQDLTVKDMTLQNGSDSGIGGGLMAGAALVLSGVDVVSNTATDANGGGVFATNGANVTGGTFRDNRCVGNCSGGALGSDSGALVVSGARFIDNTAGVNGGGVYGAASLSLTDTTFEGNVAAAGAGGAVVNLVGPGVIVNSTFTRNRAGTYGGGAYFTGAASLARTAFASNSAIEGGGAQFDGAADLTATTFINNSASLGGGVLFYGAGLRQVVNSLFAGNTATTSGTAVYVYDASPLTLIHTTITSPTLNSKSAVAAAGGTVDITNTIISQHAIGIEVTDSGTVSEDYSLFYGNSADSSGSVNSGGHSRVGDPAFANPAVFNYHLTAASAAINRGVDAGIYVDFEGDPRPQAGGFDIGYDETPFSSRYNIGNRVFLDQNQDGIQDSLEPGIADVSVSLFLGSGTLIATTATEANGHYRFDGLPAGDYVLRIDASNFAAGQALFGLISGTPDETDPNAGGDRNDNGIGTTPGAFGIASGVIHVGPGLQPTGESDLGPGDAGIPDDLANLTIDFAFVRQATSLYLPLVMR